MLVKLTTVFLRKFQASVIAKTLPRYQSLYRRANRKILCREQVFYSRRSNIKRGEKSVQYFLRNICKEDSLTLVTHRPDCNQVSLVTTSNLTLPKQTSSSNHALPN